MVVSNSKKIKEIGKGFHFSTEDCSPNICFFLVLSRGVFSGSPC